MKDWQWNGARWWKFDFHTHTPASYDYGKGPQQRQLQERTPREWLLDYMRAGLDCVAVTDHNSGAWVDKLKLALSELDVKKPNGYRPIHLFPGVEISVNGGIHVLAIFGTNKATADIDSILGAVGFDGAKKGTSNAVTQKSLTDVVKEIVNAGGITIPAHVDEDNGLFKLTGETLRQTVKCEQVFAMELVNPAFEKPQVYGEAKRSWAEILGSDAHHPSGNDGQQYPGSRFTWVKMGQPSIEGLRLALLDGPLSVLRADATSSDPNARAEMVIESIEVSQARYMGRTGPFRLVLNPWMNAVIGGRGTGKSTLVEFLRLALRRDGELPNSLKPDFEKYGQVYADRDESGLLTNAAAIHVVYRKDGISFRIQWNPSGSLDPIQEQTSQGWQRAEGDIGQRFPVRMYSQKQIFQLARTPLALLSIINDAPEVDYASWKRRLSADENQYLSLRAKIREIEAGLSEESRLKGELDDVKRKLSAFEQSGHAETLKTLQKRRRQLQAVEAWDSGLGDAGRRLREIADEICPDILDGASFDKTSQEDTRLLELVQQTTKSAEEIAAQVKVLAERADHVVTDWRKQKDASIWKAATDEAIRAYETLLERLRNEGVADPSGYGVLVQRHQTIDKQIKELEGRKNQIVALDKQAGECLERVILLRRKITEKRQTFLGEVLKDNSYVRISVVPYGAKETVEAEFRRLIQRDMGGFEKDIGVPEGEGVLGDIYQGSPDAARIEGRLATMKQTVRKTARNPQQAQVADRRFASHIAKLMPEALDRLDLWFPEDFLDVEYSTSTDRQTFRPIQGGSPGQKTAALLAFLLSYGEEPLILDQPEDDLDNHLIYDLIVTQLREVKSRRQVIVVTHNANIVVNGDAELVIALAARGGQTRTETVGCLQEKAVRQTICNIMEGGEKAFEQRYRRIALEGRHV
ncbi:MAG: ABC transporter [Acidobacteria bacterium]|nr:ABC transporter [Acidobacteriota bacterium]MBI3654823.1 ABC transporter [Acidobacteriota bacterium]